MNTLILPGFSLRNRVWASALSKEFNGQGISTVVHEWKHWETGNDSDFVEEDEDAKIIKLINDERVNILAKSVGTAVTCRLMREVPEKINKVILCGIPFLNKEKYEPLGNFQIENLMIVQNSTDPLASHDAIQKFIQNINPDITVIKKEASTHDYPYGEDFLAFLKG